MPFDGRPSSHGDGDANTDSDDDDSDSDNLCLMVGGSKTDAAKKMGFLNFFPTVEQMKQYTVGELIATEVNTTVLQYCDDVGVLVFEIFY